MARRFDKLVREAQAAMKTFANMMSALLPIAAVWAAWAQTPQVQQANPESKAVSGVAIRSLLDSACVSCHSGPQAAGGLSLDTPAGMTKGGRSGAVVSPGNASASLLFQRVVATDRAVRMPLGITPLRADQIAILKKWIDEGAVWPAVAEAGNTAAALRHWSYIKPVRPPVPSVSGELRNPIDNFILARLQKEKLNFSPEASKETIIRRVSLDLIGLPPTLEEIDAFLADGRPDAYERLVDRLLASPHYGERWARPWLDLARYADTNGY
jgi:mono/diheme cytochrome c family protein